MYFAPKEHNPPHIHAIYQANEAVFRLADGERSSGEFPGPQTRMVQAWIEIHRDELHADWSLCQNGEKPFPIAPLM